MCECSKISYSQFVTTLNSVLEIVTDLQNRYTVLETRVAKVAKIDNELTEMVNRTNTLDKKFEYVLNRHKLIEINAEHTGQILHKVVDKCKENITNIATLESKIQDIKIKQTEINTQENSNHVSKEKVNQLENEIVELKWRSMSNNLIFTGVKYEEGEDTEVLLKNFISKTMGIKKNIAFTYVHRFGNKGRTGHRPIICQVCIQE